MTIREMLKREKVMRQKKRALKRIKKLVAKREKLREQYSILGAQLEQEGLNYFKRFYSR